MPKPRYSPDARFADTANGPLTVEAAILGYIRQGAFPHVAAEAAGVPKNVFNDWLDRGLKKGKHNQRYRDLRDRVMQAEAQARVKAEIAVFQERPRDWLKFGPGKERPDNRGWSAQVAPILTNSTQVNILASAEWNGLWSVILQALAAFPDARAALSDALANLDASKPQAALPPIIATSESKA
jgi:hypothetical protein